MSERGGDASEIRKNIITHEKKKISRMTQYSHKLLYLFSILYVSTAK